MSESRFREMDNLVQQYLRCGYSLVESIRIAYAATTKMW